jgi:hypothetical protein
MSPVANRPLHLERVAGDPCCPDAVSASRVRQGAQRLERNPTPAKDLGCAAVGAGIASMSLVARLTKEKMEIQIKSASPKKFVN